MRHAFKLLIILAGRQGLEPWGKEPMAVVKLTARNIATLPGQLDRRVDYVDAILRGFTLRVPPSGSRTFAVRYFLNGKVQRYTIGPTPSALARSRP
jgi:hypothetical protein